MENETVKTGLKSLTGKQSSFLRSRGHSLKPVLQIGKAGITESFIKQLKSALATHELIKIKLLKSSPVDINQAAEEISHKTACQVAQKIGKTLLLFKKAAKDSKIELPK
ncbi:MAG: ribosome assembly RNA-binding protein YhbY [Deltaproteobacteria bacterium]|nr:ribosome assembly RNA-binding protein YhbY [Deltaproteobacteria bacterium]